MLAIWSIINTQIHTVSVQTARDPSTIHSSVHAPVYNKQPTFLTNEAITTV
jgi:hypothetical protein